MRATSSPTVALRVARPYPRVCHICQRQISIRRVLTGEDHIAAQIKANLDASGTRAIYRDIFRLSSYLADDVVRQWSRDHARSRFTRYRTYISDQLYEARESKPYDAEQTKDEIQARIKDLLSQARNFASTLRRATEGERRPLLAITEKAYGKRGKRRRDLLTPLLYTATQAQKRLWIRHALLGVDGEEDAHEVVDLIMSALEIPQKAFLSYRHLSYPSPANPDTEADETKAQSETKKAETNRPVGTSFPPLSPALRLLAESQMQNQTKFRSSASSLRRIQPIIPEFNSWMRPMPWKRVKNMQKEGYTAFLEKVNVPLGIREWERLRKLASGELELKAPKRRKIGRSPQASGKNGSGKEREINVEALEMVMLQARPDPRKAFENREAHALTPKYIQRLYRSIFEGSTKLEYNSVRKEWIVTWGFQVL